MDLKIIEELNGLKKLLTEKFEETNTLIASLNERVGALEKRVVVGGGRSNEVVSAEGGEEISTEGFMGFDFSGFSEQPEDQDNEDFTFTFHDGENSNSDEGISFSFSSVQPQPTTSNASPMEKKTKFKICVIGAAKVGKTFYIKRLRERKGEGVETSEPDEVKYNATLGVVVHDLNYRCSDGTEYTLSFWDTAGDERYGGLRDGYFIGSEAGLFFYDDEEYSSFTKLTSIHFKDFRRVIGDTPFTIVCNTMNTTPEDVENPTKKKKKGSSGNVMNRNYGGSHHEINVKCEEDRKKILEPVEFLLRKLTGNENIEIVDEL